MSLRVYKAPMLWTPLSIRGFDREQLQAVTSRLESVLEGWRWTPYESGQCARGRGADCIGAVFGAVDEMDGRDRRLVSGLPRDAAMHRRHTAVKAMRRLVRAYQPAEKVEPEPGQKWAVQPGDIVVIGEQGGGPGHVMMVGPRRNTLWDATPGPGFQQKGWSLLDTNVLWAVYRLGNREEWLR